MFADVVSAKVAMFHRQMVAGIASRIMNYKHTVSDRDLVEIENGWDEKQPFI